MKKPRARAKPKPPAKPRFIREQGLARWLDAYTLRQLEAAWRVNDIGYSGSAATTRAVHDRARRDE